MKKITLITDNRVGILAEVSEMLFQASINIEDFKAESLEDCGYIHLVVDNYDQALRVFQGSAYMAYTEEIILIKIEDRPGGLAAVAKKLRDSGIDVRSMRIARRTKLFAIVAMVCTPLDKAREVVKEIVLS